LKAGTKKDGGGMATSARVAKITQAIQRLENPGRALVDNPTTYARLEEKLLGCAINHSQLNSCSDAAFANTTCIEIKNGKLAKSTIAGIVKQIKIFRTKKDQDMAFLSIEDESSELENIVVFPDIYEQHKDIIYEESTLLLTGEVKDPKRGSFIVESVFMI
ncbi:MAG: OB-fold nucleic acid binding domain-containing protein, partial [Roseovarius sp.]